MKRTFSHIIGLLCTISCCAQQLVFSPLDTSDGLSSNCVLHILELPDGRIAATTPQSIDVWDGQRFQIIPKDTLSSTPLPGYQGAYHVYADKNNRLWVKDYRKIWCYDKQLQFIPDCLPDSANDVFVDDQGDVFFIQQDTTHLLLDLKTFQGKQYRFYANGEVVCSEGNRLLYAVQASLDSTAITSLVVTDTLRGRFYQLIDQKLCLEFDTHTRRWTEIFRANRLHTISLTDNNTAFIVSRDGMWKIDLPSRKAEQIEQVLMTDGSYISSSRLNTIFTDRNGNVWIGSYDHGLLVGRHADASESHTPLVWILTGVGGFVCLMLLWWFFGRKRKGEHTDSTVSDTLSTPPATAATIPIDHELVSRATTLVEQHLATPNYTVERLAQDLCMDRTGLYKKMTAMLGKTPTAFIRGIRVNHAVQLIQTTSLTMTEVAEQSGFSSASYMAKCFQEDLGKNPSELKGNQPKYSVDST